MREGSRSVRDDGYPVTWRPNPTVPIPDPLVANPDISRRRNSHYRYRWRRLGLRCGNVNRDVCLLVRRVADERTGDRSGSGTDQSPLGTARRNQGTQAGPTRRAHERSCCRIVRCPARCHAPGQDNGDQADESYCQSFGDPY
jgi:hypothetical protein